MSDLVSVLALPAVWSGQEPRQIVTTFHDALLATLNLEFVYTRARTEANGGLIEIFKTATAHPTTPDADKIHQTLNKWFSGDPQRWPTEMRSLLGGREVSLVSRRLGIEGEIGIVIAGSERADFPTQSERLLLAVAANQVTIGLQQARLLSEQKRIADELDRRVAERTSELARANEGLLLQVGLLQHLPVVAWTLRPDGTPDFVNQVWLDYSGQTLDFVCSYPGAWMTAVHPEDRAAASRSFWEGIRSGRSFAMETRFRAHDGTYRWHLNRAVVLHDTEGKVLKFVGTSTDIDDQKNAQEALRASETNLREILDGIPGFVCTLNPAGQIDLANRPLLDFFGMTVEELNSWGTNGAVHPDDLPRVIAELTDAMTTGTPFDSELRYRRADGIDRWSQTRILPVRDLEGKITRWYGLITDIDDRKRAEEALRESEYETRLIVDSIPGIIGVASPSGNIDMVSRQALEFFGRTIEELREWGTNDTIPPEDLPGVIDAYSRAISAGRPFEFQMRLRRADGVYRWFQERGFPLRDKGGSIARWYLLITDIDDQKRAEKALRESEYESRLIVDSIPGLIAVLGTGGEIERVSQPLLDYLGKSLEECRQWAVDDTIHPDDRPGYLQAFERAYAAGDPVEYEAARIRRFDGVYRWLSMRGLPLRDRQGHILRWYFLLTDVDDRKRAEDELRRSEARHRVVVETASDAVLSIDESGAIILANPATKRIFGYTPEELIGKPLTVLMPGAMRGLHEKGFQRYLETGARQLNWQGTEMTALRENGEEFPAEVSFGEMTSDQRRVFTGFIRDISEKKRSEAELRNSQAELARMTRAMTIGQLTASIAHEVNQPLSGIVMNASTCLRMLNGDEPNIEGARETARRTIRDGNRASEVVARLRTLFKRKEVADESIDLNDAAREVIALSLSELQSGKILVRHDFAESLPAVKGDRIQIQQVILNLIRNALDAMRDVDNRPRELLIKTESDDDKSVRLIVRDTGIGFVPDAVDRLFDSFYTTKDDGMGIGLSLSRSIIEAHRGRIWAAANEGPGSSFTFSIPRDYSVEPA